MRPSHFFLMLFEYNREAEQKFKLQAELIRLQTTLLINSQRPAEKQINPLVLWKFPWDNEVELQKRLDQMSREELEEHYKKFINPNV